MGGSPQHPPVVTLAALYGLGGYVSGAGSQSDSAIASVRVTAGGVPAVTLLAAGAVMLTYPLTEKAFRGIVGEIAERRAAAAFTPAGSVTTAP